MILRLTKTDTQLTESTNHMKTSNSLFSFKNTTEKILSKTKNSVCSNIIPHISNTCVSHINKNCTWIFLSFKLFLWSVTNELCTCPLWNTITKPVLYNLSKNQCEYLVMTRHTGRQQPVGGYITVFGKGIFFVLSVITEYIKAKWKTIKIYITGNIMMLLSQHFQAWVEIINSVFIQRECTRKVTENALYISFCYFIVFHIK